MSPDHTTARPALARLPTVAGALTFAVGALLALTPAASAAEPEVLYPAKVFSLQGRIFEFASLGHEYPVGEFVYYDGETEGRVSWRDLDRVTFVRNLRHQPGSEGPQPDRTRRVKLTYIDGTERYVNVVMGRIHGHDGVGERHVHARELSVIDFDEVRIAPMVYMTCERGHVWEQKDYRFCPYDGGELGEVPAGR